MSKPTDTVAAEAVNPLAQWSRDPEDCDACASIEDDMCPYHHGLWDGVAWFSQAVHALALDTDIGTAVHAIIAKRRDLQDEWSRATVGTRSDAPIPRTAPRFDVGDVVLHHDFAGLYRVEAKYWAGTLWLYRVRLGSTSIVAQERDLTEPGAAAGLATPARLQVVDGGGPQ